MRNTASSPRTRSHVPALSVAGLGAIVVVAAALRAPLLGGGQLDYDEGVYWQSLHALAAGHPLFTAVYSSQPPAFLLLLLPGHLALGGTIAAERLTVLALGLAGIAAAGRTAWVLAGPGAGLLAAALLAADPLFLRQSVTLQADGPAVALGLVALAAAAESRARRAWPGDVLAAGAGAVLAVALLTKLLAVAAGPAVALLLVARADRLRALAAAALGGVAAGAAVLLPFAGAWPALWTQAVGMHLAARALPLGGLDAGTVLRELPAVAVAVAAIAAGRDRRGLLPATAAVWAAGAAAVLAVQHPLWSHHAVVAAPALALLGAGLVAAVPLRAAALAAAVALAASTLPAAYVRSQQQPPAVTRAEVAALRADPAPGALVVTDDQFTAAAAGRATPPELVDTSFVRITSGDLTTATVEAVAARPGVGAVLLATGRLALLPGLRAWLARTFPTVLELDRGQVLYVRRA